MSQQSARQASVRARTATEYDYNADWSALFDIDGIPAGDWNGRLLAWLNVQLAPDVYDSLPAAQTAFAEANGAPNWSSLGAFTA